MRTWLFAAVFAACSGPSFPSIPADQLVDAIVTAECEHAVTCQMMPDEATCVDLSPSSYLLETTVADVIAGTIHYDPHLGGACVEYLRSRPCNAGGTGGTYYTGIVAMYFTHDHPCVQMLKGTVPDGGACNEQAQCADYGDCDGPPCDWFHSCCGGTCLARPEAALGQPCPGDHCPEHAYCAGVCDQQITTEGASCGASDACAPPLGCYFPTRSQAGTCVAQPPLPPPPTLAGIGEPCDYSGSCVGYANCIGSPGICVARLLPGDACTVAGGALTCLGDANCTSSVCVLTSPGMACP